MITLKNILAEIDAESGDLDNFVSVNVRDEFSGCLRKIPSIVPSDVTDYMKSFAEKSKNKVYWLDLNYKLPIDGKLKTWLKSKKIAQNGNYYVIKLLVPSGRKYIEYFLFDENEKLFDKSLIGFVRTTKTNTQFSDFNLNKIYKLSGEEIQLSFISRNARGTGVGSLLYDMVLDHAGVLFSGNTLYQGSFNMWTRHFTKREFFGCLLNPTETNNNRASVATSVPVPVDVTATDTDWLISRANRFFVLKDRSLLPSTVRRLEYNLYGVDLASELIFVTVDENYTFRRSYLMNGEKTGKQYTIEDYLDNFASIDDWYESVSNHNDEDTISNIITFQPIDEFASSYSRVKLAIVRCNNALLLLKNKSDGISLQLLT